jgi:hypothetical protein
MAAKSKRRARKSGVGRADSPAPPGKNDVIRRGATTNFVMFYQASLGNQGIQIADALLQTCEAQYQTIRGWFGGIVPGSLPFHVTVTDSAKGASHPRCASTQIQVGAKSGSGTGGDDFMRNLLFSEVAEVFMAKQDKYWDCGASNGEALSRVLAADITMPRRTLPLGFRCGPAWLADRKDWINHTEGTDQDTVATGCGVLFLNWLRFGLGFSWAAIIAAGAPHLADTYATLTKKTDALSAFLAVIESLFKPKGPNDPKQLVNDNPFWHSGSPVDSLAPAADAPSADSAVSAATAATISTAFQDVLGQLKSLPSAPPGEKRFLFPDGIGEIDFSFKIGASEGVAVDVKVIGAKQ